MMKKFFKLLIFCFAFFFCYLNTYALDFDISSNCSIRGNYGYSSKNFADQNIYLYKIADFNSDGSFKYSLDFRDYGTDVNTLVSSQWDDLAKNLKIYINDKKISFLDSDVTNADGDFKFSDLSTGIYLVLADNCSDDKYIYSASPSLVTVPNYNELSGEYMYDAALVLKTESKAIDPGNSGNSNVVDVPNTIDMIKYYVIALAISVFSCCIVVAFLVYEGRKYKNEEKTNN